MKKDVPQALTTYFTKFIHSHTSAHATNTLKIMKIHSSSINSYTKTARDAQSNFIPHVSCHA